MRIEATQNGTVLVDEIETFGKQEEYRVEDNGEYALKIETEGFVGVDELLSKAYNKSGQLKSVEIDLEVDGILAEIVPKSQSSETSSTESSLGEYTEEPELPDVESFPNSVRKEFYQRMKAGKETQPAFVRRALWKEGETTLRRLKELMEEGGYSSESGGINTALAVLENETQEIEREQTGDGVKIVWVGK